MTLTATEFADAPSAQIGRCGAPVFLPIRMQQDHGHFMSQYQPIGRQVLDQLGIGV